MTDQKLPQVAIFLTREQAEALRAHLSWVLKKGEKVSMTVPGRAIALNTDETFSEGKIFQGMVSIMEHPND